MNNVPAAPERLLTFIRICLDSLLPRVLPHGRAEATSFGAASVIITDFVTLLLLGSFRAIPHLFTEIHALLPCFCYVGPSAAPWASAFPLFQPHGRNCDESSSSPWYRRTIQCPDCLTSKSELTDGLSWRRDNTRRSGGAKWCDTKIFEVVRRTKTQVAASPGIVFARWGVANVRG